MTNLLTFLVGALIIMHILLSVSIVWMFSQRDPGEGLITLYKRVFRCDLKGYFFHAIIGGIMMTFYAIGLFILLAIRIGSLII
jgi:hypothetical protein